MKYEVVPNSCRVCLRKCKKLRSIFKPLDEGDEPPNEMLKMITGIAVEEPTDVDELPKNICKGCELSLNLAYQFRIKALKSQRVIEVYCVHQQHKNVVTTDAGVVALKDEDITTDLKTKDELRPIQLVDTAFMSCEKEQENAFIEMKVEDLEMPFSDDAKIEYLEDSCDEEECHVMYSSVDELPLGVLHQQDENTNLVPESGAKVTENIEELRKELDSLEKLLEAKDPGYKAQPVEINNKPVEIPPIKKRAKRGRKPKYDIEELKQRLIDSDQYKLVEVKNKEPGAAPKLKLLAKRTGRPKVNDESGHICDICGNIYSKRGRMMEHRRRHDKELRFACELCDKRFHLREKLRKHMFSHSGGKPYQCSFCSRTFFYESVKKAHEAVHKGVKPYICEVCNKAFAYSHALKKHKLIHAEIKLYHCEYCDKDFRLQHHMKQHEETKLHQNAVKAAECGRIADG